MTLLPATALGDTPDELYERARLAARAADIVEVRLDGPSGLPWDLRPFFALDKPALATVRATEDGGRSGADDETRAGILRRALLAGAAYVDIEFASDAAKTLIDEAHAKGVRVVLSLHDLRGTPRADELREVLRRMRAMGADVAKLATRVDRREDAAALVDAAKFARAESIPAAVMAVNDPILRLAAPNLGLALAYGSVPGQPAAAPGQVPADALKRAHDAQPAKLSFLLGHPVAHSRSPAMQDAAFRAAGLDARYLAADVTDLPAAVAMLRALRPLGANVTVPHKEAIVPLLDDLAPSAKEAGAVNTLEFVDDRVVGHNTDGAGALDALREAGFRPKRALVLGAGGTARAIVAALRASCDVAVANRTPGKAETFAPATLAWGDVADADADLLVNATSVGLTSERDLPLPRGCQAVLDCVYGETPLVRKATQAGLRVVRGEAMLLHQGARAFRIWTGVEPDISAMRRALG